MRIFLICISFFLFISPALAQKNDTVYLKNGDRITGELKKAEFGLIHLSTFALDNVTIENDKVSTMFSAKNFEFRMKDGSRYYGSVSTSTTPGVIYIMTGLASIEKPIKDIVQIVAIKSKFFQKLDGSIGLGLSYSKASEVLDYNVNGNITYRSSNYSVRVGYNSIVTNPKSDQTSRNNNSDINITRYFPKKWFALATSKGQQNTELDLKYRFQSGLGGGYDIVRTSRHRFYGMTEVLVNYEETIDSSYTSLNCEALASLQYKWFDASKKKIDITSGFNYYPNLTVNRHRIEAELNIKIEIFKDFFFGLNIYDTYDSKNLSTQARKNDWGIINSISYSF